MKVNFFRLLLKIWITVVSVIAFLGGWVIFGHSGKPVSASSASQPVNNNDPSSQLAPLPTLAPLPSLNDNSQGFQPLPQVQQQPLFSAQPRFRTMGS